VAALPPSIARGPIMRVRFREPVRVPDRRARAERRGGLGLLALGAVALAAVLLTSCAGAPAVDYGQRIEAAKRGLAEEDPAIQARAAEVEAARVREQGEVLIDEIELRLGGEYDEPGHRLRVLARIPVKRPGELRTRREVLRADTEVAVARLEEASLERRAELCFPSVDVLVHRVRVSIYDTYATRQQALLEWNEEGRSAGTIDELAAARFEIESRIKLATREPARPPQVEVVMPVLPEIGTRPTGLVQAPPLLRETVRRHHPSAAVRRATAEHYRALSDRAQSQARPWLKFVDVSYEHESGGGGSHGAGGQLAFEIPLGTRERASAGRYRALVRQEQSEEQRLVEEQVRRSLEALGELSDFEARGARWEELQALALAAEQIADRWWRGRLARPSQVAALLDQAFAARSAVLEARERAGIAGCTLLAMTGVPPQSWPRQ
jgi:hypothetical protein